MGHFLFVLLTTYFLRVIIFALCLLSHSKALVLGKSTNIFFQLPSVHRDGNVYVVKLWTFIKYETLTFIIHFVKLGWCLYTGVFNRYFTTYNFSLSNAKLLIDRQMSLQQCDVIIPKNCSTHFYTINYTLLVKSLSELRKFSFVLKLLRFSVQRQTNLWKLKRLLFIL